MAKVICSRKDECDLKIPCRLREPFELIERYREGWSCDWLPMPRQRCVAVNCIEVREDIYGEGAR